jgi:hypothetical protein
MMYRKIIRYFVTYNYTYAYSFWEINFMLPACGPNLAEVALTMYKAVDTSGIYVE